MSATTPAHELDEIQGRDDASNIFRRYVFEDPAVCSSCFQRLKQNGRRTVWASKGHDKESKDDIPEYAQYDAREAYGEIAVFPMRTVCEDCGSIAGRALDDTLSKRDAVRCADTLADRLEELGEPVEVDVLKYAVGKLKADPRLRGLDTEIFARATKIAVRRARRS